MHMSEFYTKHSNFEMYCKRHITYNIEDIAKTIKLRIWYY